MRQGDTADWPVEHDPLSPHVDRVAKILVILLRVPEGHSGPLDSLPRSAICNQTVHYTRLLIEK